MFESVPRWVRVSAVILGVSIGSEVLYEVYLGWKSYCQERRARQRANSHINMVFFTNERSIQANAPGTTMANFTSEHVCRIVALLDRARVSINLGMYIITVSNIGDALLRAAKRGVRVRVVGCSSMAYSTGSQMTRLANAGIPVRFDRKESAYLMHHKFCLIDTDWLCPRCYHEEKVQRKGFCCKAVFDKGASGNASTTTSAVVISAGAMANGQSDGDQVNGYGSPTSGSGKVQCVDDGSRCVHCDKQKKNEVEKCKLKNEQVEPLPIGGLLITGSTNWTMQAMSGNWDNMLLTSLPELVIPFQLEFQRLWRDFAHHPLLVSPASG
ncbi:mitochondrial cardiolipin hydrolase [Ochlerotatus camptorhynchus]|uniref:mitochondrial cardiolipin hydrolase n=1 Tax=Ochlerotatus camptorhynchus TaxID=644619 RepID=UPI0031DE5FE5